MNVIPVILAGGAGTRLWPLSRDEKPKQFHNLSGDGTLLEETIKRLLPLDPEQIVIVTSKTHLGLSREELGKFTVPGTVLAEPRPRNTAAALLYAALYLGRLFDDSIMISLPADHHILNTVEFVRILREAIRQAEDGRLVTIGIKPTYPETGYGYIKAVKGDGQVLPIDTFVEKPDIDRARQYFQSGNYYWNSGIFVWKARVVLEELRQYAPDVLRPLAELAETGDHLRTGDAELERVFQDMPSISIDYSIMEKSRRIVLARGDFGWSDLGSWDSLEDVLAMDNSNVTIGAPMILVDTRRCVVCAHDRLVACVGVEDLVVVATGDAVLVAHKDKAQEVRQVVQKLEADGRDEYL